MPEHVLRVVRSHFKLWGKLGMFISLGGARLFLRYLPTRPSGSFLLRCRLSIQSTTTTMASRVSVWCSRTQRG